MLLVRSVVREAQPLSWQSNSALCCRMQRGGRGTEGTPSKPNRGCWASAAILSRTLRR
jgi:hypothetical protein